MAGKHFLNNGLLLLLLLCFCSCLQAAEGKWIAVLLSDSEEAFEMPVQSFTDSIGMQVRTFNLKGEVLKEEPLKRTLGGDNPPALVLTMGAKATYAAKLWTRQKQDIPIIFAMVLNWQKYNILAGQTNIAGISSEINPGNQLLNLTMFAPDVRKVGVIYSPKHSTEIVQQGQQATDLLGLELIEKHVTRSADFKKKYRQLVGKVDALWVLGDPVTYSIENMSWLERRCIKDKLVCVSPSRNLTQIGLMLSVGTDVTNIGVQAASMAKNILFRDQDIATLGVMEPLGTQIFLNKRTADSIGLQVSSQAIHMATEVIE